MPWSAVFFDNAIFDGTAGTVTLGVAVRAHDLIFNTTGYNVNGSTLTLGGTAPTITVNAGSLATIGSVLAGTVGMSKSGTGTLVVFGTNSYSGGTTITAGTLQVGTGATTGTLGSGAITNSAALVINRSNAITFSQTIDGTGTVSQAGAGTTTLTGANTYSGATTISAGVLQVGSGGTAGTLGSGAVTNDAGLIFNRSDAITVGNDLSGTGTLTKSGAGTTTLTGTNTYSGTTTITAGILQVGAGGTTGSVGSGAITNNAALRINRSDAVSLGQNITGTGTLTQLGTGTTTLIGANTYSGVTTISGGTLQVGSGGTVGTLGSGAVTNNAALVINRSDAVTIAQVISGTGTVTQAGTGTTTVTATNTYSGGTIVSAGTLEVGNGGLIGALGAGAITNDGALVSNRSNAITFGQAISGTGTLTKLGAGTTTLTGANTYSGTTTISAGVLQVGSGGTAGSLGSGAVTNDAGLIFNRSDAITVGNDLSGTGTLTKSGAGTTTLTGTNTYSGTTTITAGVLQVGAGGTTGSVGSGAITNNAALRINRSDAVTLGQTITGTGTLTQLGTGTTTLTGANTYSGVTTISGGTLQVGSGGTVGTLGSGTVTNNAVLEINRSDAVTLARVISGTGRLTQAGTGTTTVTATNNYSGGTTISAGTLQVGNGGTTGVLGAGPITNNAALVINRSNAITFGQAISGTGTLTKLGGGTMTLTGANTYSGTTTIGAGLLRVGNGGTLGSLGSGSVTNNAGLVFNRSDAITVGNDISGAGTLTKLAAGTTTLTGTNTYSGTTSVNAGTLQVNGSLGNTATTVASGATLGGSGTIAGNVTVNAGGKLAPGNSPGTLTVGSLNLLAGAVLNYELATPGVVGGGVNDLIESTGNVTLDGTLNVAALPGFGTGTFRLMNYAGTFTNNVLDFGLMPFGFAYQLQTAVVGRVNLLVGNATPEPVQYWDGGSAVGDGVVEGGSGIWTAGPTNWTTSDGSFNQAWGGQTAAFAGAPGTVAVVGPISFNGLQFQTSGYTLATGSGGVLTTTTADTVISLGPSVAATIEVPIAGSGGINVQGTGTLIFTGENSYTGGTAIGAGATLQLGNGGTSGAIVGNVANDGTLAFNRSDTITFGGAVSGAGVLRQDGPGTLILTGTNTYTGGTAIANASTLQIGDGGTSGSIVGAVANDGTLSFNRSDTITFGGNVSGAGVLRQDGKGTLILTGSNGYTGGTVIANDSTLQIGDGGTSGSITGAVTNNGTMVFNRSDTIAFGGGIAGPGAVRQDGVGTLVLSGANSYSGGTSINAGTLSISADENLGTGSLFIDGATLQMTATFSSSRPTSLSARGGTIKVDTGTNFTATSSLSGAGTLTKRDDGTLTLGGTNTYGGGTRLEAGTVSISQDANLGASSGAVTFDGGTLRTTADLESARAFSINSTGTIETVNGSTLLLRDSIAGAGSLNKSGNGTLVLAGTNTYAGGTLVSAGTLQGNTRSLQGEIVDNDALVFDQTFDGSFRGTLFGSGAVTKRGSGTVSLTGNHGLQGRMTIQSGTLAMDGTLAGAVSVLGAGTFNAAGIVGGSLSVDGRVDVPALASGEFGLLSVVGDVTFRPEATYGITLDAAGRNIALTANGDAGVQGATISVTAQPGAYQRVTQYAVLRGQSGLSGVATVAGSSPVLEPLLSKNDTTLFVTLLNREIPLQRFAISDNGWGIAGALDRLKREASGDLADVTRELTALDDRSLARSLDAISGEIHASAVQLAAIDGEGVTDTVRSEITTRILNGGSETGGPSDAKWGFEGGRGWFRLRSERIAFDADEPVGARAGLRGVHGGDGSINGFAVGGDWTRAGRWLFGAGGSFSKGRLALDILDDSATFTAPRGMAYLGFAGTGWAVNGGVAVARTAYETTRALQFTAFAPGGGVLLKGGVDRTAASRPAGMASEAWSEVRGDRYFGRWRVQPTAGLRGTRYGLNEWTETGADSLSLSAPARSVTSLQADLGVRFSRGFGRFRPFLSATARRELTAGRTTVALTLVDQPNGRFEVDGLRLPLKSTMGQAGVLIQTEKIGLSVMYEARSSRQQLRQTIQLAIGFQ